jgi:hypothetical protein
MEVLKVGEVAQRAAVTVTVLAAVGSLRRNLLLKAQELCRGNKQHLSFQWARVPR